MCTWFDDCSFYPMAQAKAKQNVRSSILQGNSCHLKQLETSLPADTITESNVSMSPRGARGARSIFHKYSHSMTNPHTTFQKTIPQFSHPLPPNQPPIHPPPITHQQITPVGAKRHAGRVVLRAEGRIHYPRQRPCPRAPGRTGPKRPAGFWVVVRRAHGEDGNTAVGIGRAQVRRLAQG